MKHIFYVHSYVTYLVTLGVIEHNKIQDEDVLLISARNAVTQKRFKEIDFSSKYPKLFGIPCYGEGLFFLKNLRFIKSFDGDINRFCHTDRFLCYLPTDKHFGQQLLMTHKNCVGISYIEEGLFTYNNEFKKRTWPFHGLLGSLKRYLNTGNRNINPLKRNNGSSVLFTLFDPYYYRTDLSIRCVMPSIPDIEYNGIILENTNILMMNAFKDASVQVQQQLLLLLEKFAEELFERKEKIYIKHHPYATEILKRQIELVFSKSGVCYDVLDASLNTELMLFNSRNLSIYGFFSAAMLYGAMMGHKSITFLYCFETQSQSCREYIANNFPIPEVFKNYSMNYEYKTNNT